MHVTLESTENGTTKAFTFMNRNNDSTNEIEIYLKGYSERPEGTTARTATWDMVTPTCLNSKNYEDIVLPTHIVMQAILAFSRVIKFGG